MLTELDECDEFLGRSYFRSFELATSGSLQHNDRRVRAGAACTCGIVDPHSWGDPICKPDSQCRFPHHYRPHSQNLTTFDNLLIRRPFFWPTILPADMQSATDLRDRRRP